MTRTAPRPAASHPPTQEVYTVPEAAVELRESTNSVYALCRLGRLPGAYKIGTGGRTSGWRIPADALSAYRNNAA